MQAIRTMARQGDVLLQAIDNPSSMRGPMTRLAPERDREILAHGEVTGHHHSFALSDRVTRFRDDGGAGGSTGRTFLSVQEGAPVALEHQEHTTIPVAPGVYRVRRQRTYHGGMAQRVAD